MLKITITMKRRDTGEVIASEVLSFGDSDVFEDGKLKPMAVSAIIAHQEIMVPELIEFEVSVFTEVK